MNPRTKIIRKLDAWFSKLIRERDKACLRCGRTVNLQCAHIFSRSKMSVRWDEANALTLCGGCHIFWGHKNPLEFYDWIREKILGPEKFLKLRQKSDMKWKTTAHDLELFFKSVNP